MILPLQRWHDHPHGVLLTDAFMLVEFMPEWSWMHAQGRVDSLLRGLPSNYCTPEFRFSKRPMIPKSAVLNAIPFVKITCQACNGKREEWVTRHTCREYRGCKELCRFNSEIFDAIAGKRYAAVCARCARRFKDDPNAFLAKLLAKDASNQSRKQKEQVAA